MASNTPEGKVKKLVKDWLAAQNAYTYMPMTMGYGASGAPDFMVCINGVFVGIETKAPGKRNHKNRGLTALQMQASVAIREAGGYFFIVDGADDIMAMQTHLRFKGVI
jgi:hypothetical protein